MCINANKTQVIKKINFFFSNFSFNYTEIYYDTSCACLGKMLERCYIWPKPVMYVYLFTFPFPTLITANDENLAYTFFF